MKLVFTLLFFVGCNSMRKIDMCIIHETFGECSRGDKRYQLQYPLQMQEWVCWNIESQVILGEKLEQCEREQRLPRNDMTWEDLPKETIPTDVNIVSYICTNKSGAQKIVSKLNYCRTH